MSETLLIALLNFGTRFGFAAMNAAALASKAKTLDEAIAALAAAEVKSLDQYKAEDKILHP